MRPSVSIALVLAPPALILAAILFGLGGVAADPGLTGQVLALCALLYLAATLLSFLRRGWAAWLISSAFLATFGLVLSLGLIDDAYISLRYARNLGDGHGLVFNVGERVEGYTSFLWVWLLGAARSLSARLDLVLLAKILGVSSASAVLFLTSRIAAVMRREESGAPHEPALILLPAAHFPLVFWAFSGMETAFYVALLLGSIFCFCRYIAGGGLPWTGASGMLLTLAMMTRPESYLLAAGFLLFLVLKERKFLSRQYLSFAWPLLLLFVPYFMWRWHYFGYPFPNTYYAKVGAPLSDITEGISYIAYGMVPHVLLITFLVRGLFRERVRLVSIKSFLLSILALLMAAVLITGGDHFAEWRYFVYLLPFLYLLSASEMARATAAVKSRLARAHLVAALCLIFLLSPFYYGSVGPEAARLFGANLAVRWAELGEWFERNTTPEQSIATPVIGAIGYYSNRTVIDMVGLTDTTITHEGDISADARRDHQRYNTEYLLGRQPAFIYLMCEYPDERTFLRAPHWIPAVQDLKRYFPNREYRYLLLRGWLHDYALYRSEVRDQGRTHE